ncbi:MAG: 5'-deoxynucleotidase [Lachnospiraceae bacterium]|nr:5'-deoxynucleotidase [Lachnospiraceae bacterium]
MSSQDRTYTFFASVSRMKYIERWALMRASRPENLSEHSLEVAMIAHALCVLGNVRHGRALNAEKAALTALYHDATEIITGDMPTPVKYGSESLKRAYKSVEHEAGEHLLARLPEDLRPVYEPLFAEESEAVAEGEAAENERYMRRLVKAADKLSALIKCIEEEGSGNREFATAKASTERAVAAMREELPEVDDFCREFLPPYGSTLDELS